MSKVEKNSLLHVRDLSVVIERDEGIVRPLNGVSFSIQPGQAIGIVGESGCGKTMTSNAILRILPPGSKITSGQIQFQAKEDVDPVDLVKIDPDGPEKLRQAFYVCLCVPLPVSGTVCHNMIRNEIELRSLYYVK